MRNCRKCNLYDCACWVVDRSLRLSPKAQIEAFLEMENWFGDQPDECWDWYVYFRSIGWTEDQISGFSPRPQFDDEVLNVVPDGVSYSCNLR